jgi:homoserine dehydrogenase
MKLLIIGFGTVGQALAALFDQSRGRLLAAHGLQPTIVGVVDSKSAVCSHQGIDTRALLEAKRSAGGLASLPGSIPSPANAAELIAETDADCLVQAIPSNLSAPAAAVDQLKAAFVSHKHAVTVTKAPLGVAMAELIGLAAASRVQFRYSGTVGAGTPFLDLASSLAKSDQIESVEAILNGTTNFILSSMHDRGMTYEQALAEATKLGYAETDPSNDVDGIDTAVKLVILANHAMNAGKTFADAKVKGIRSVTAEHVAAAKASGTAIRLIGRIDRRGLRVAPEEVLANGPLDLPGATNTAVFHTKTCGPVTLRASGAGGPNTATAILRDLVDIWRSTKA